MRRCAHERFFCGEEGRKQYPQSIVNVIQNGEVKQHTLLPELLVTIFMELIERPE